MMIHGITSSDLLAADIERFHPGQNILVVHLNDSEGCQQVLEDLKNDLLLAIPNRIELDSEYIMIGSHREELTKFLQKHHHLVCDTRLELYVCSSCADTKKGGRHHAL